MGAALNLSTRHATKSEKNVLFPTEQPLVSGKRGRPREWTIVRVMEFIVQSADERGVVPNLNDPEMRQVKNALRNYYPEINYEQVVSDYDLRTRKQEENRIWISYRSMKNVPDSAPNPEQYTDRRLAIGQIREIVNGATWVRKNAKPERNIRILLGRLNWDLLEEHGVLEHRPFDELALEHGITTNSARRIIVAALNGDMDRRLKEAGINGNALFGVYD